MGTRIKKFFSKFAAKIILALEILISFALRVPSLIEFYYVGFSITGSQSELCLGLDFEASMIMNRYFRLTKGFNSIFEKNILFKRKSNEEVLFATNLKNIHLFGFFIVIAWQFVSYIWILYHLRNHNDSMFKKNILDKHTLIQRKKTNIVTFYGQLFNFIMEMAFIFGLFIVFNFTIVENSLIPICMLITSSIYSMVEFFTSPEMKRVYWKNIWFRL